jgi:hypothetical protein
MATMLTSLTTFGLLVGLLMVGVPAFGVIMLIGVKIIEGYERLKYGHK